MTESGYLLFENRRIKGPPPEASMLTDLNHWRTRCFDVGLIGTDASGVGFGNVSVRIPGTQRFVVSGSQTGGKRVLAVGDYAKVVDTCLDRNVVVSVGRIAASSESLAHAAVYRASGRVGAVFHVHSKLLWEKLIDAVPTTDRHAAAGTVAMAREVARLVPNVLGRGNVIVMGGHRDGLIAFGAGPEAAACALLEVS